MDKPAAAPPPPPERPATPMPEGAWDAHVHMVAAPEEFPLWDGRAEDPAPGRDLDGWIAAFRDHLSALGAEKALVVHSILYGADNSVTLEALRRLGPGVRGIGLLPDGAPERDLDRFAEAGLCGVRLNYVHGGVLSWDGAKAMAPALADRGIHIQMLLHTDRHMETLAPDIAALPVPLVVDHIGWPDLSLGVDDPGFRTLCRLMAEGHVYVKLSALYRLCPAPHEAADPFVAALVAANPDRCLWGSDWPHLMLNGADMPVAARLLDAFHRVVTDDDTRRRILVDTPEALFAPRA